VWAALAGVGAVGLGMALRTAERRDRPAAAAGADAVSGRSSVSGPLRGIPRQERR
jgi:hypothetical protein